MFATHLSMPSPTNTKMDAGEVSTEDGKFYDGSHQNQKGKDNYLISTAKINRKELMTSDLQEAKGTRYVTMNAANWEYSLYDHRENSSPKTSW